MSDLELHQMNPQNRFTSRAEDYAQYRPSYPNAAIDRIITKASGNSPIHSRLDGKSDLQINSLFSQVERHSFTYQQAFELRGLIGLAMSASYMPQTGTAHRQLLDDRRSDKAASKISWRSRFSLPAISNKSLSC